VSTVRLHVKTRINNKHNNKNTQIYRYYNNISTTYDNIVQFRVNNNILLEYGVQSKGMSQINVMD